MDIFTYEFCKELLVYTGAGILIGGCILWYLYIIVQILVKATKLFIRFVKWIKTKKHPVTETPAQDTDN